MTVCQRTLDEAQQLVQQHGPTIGPGGNVTAPASPLAQPGRAQSTIPA